MKNYKVSFIRSSYQRFFQQHKKELLEAIEKCLSNGDLILGDEVDKFESNFAEFVGTKYCVALNSGTDALVFALKAAWVGSSRWSVSVPSYTFKATAGAVKTAAYDATIDFYDLDNLPNDPDVTIVAHIAGELYPIPQTGIVIEDAAQALGAVKTPTTFAQTWSFYPAKILGAYGDAGALTTNNKEVYEYVREARDHCKKYNKEFGTNSRMDNIQAAILNVKMRYLPKFLARRTEIANLYHQGLMSIPIHLPIPKISRVWQDYIIQTNRRNALFTFLKEKGIETIKNEYPMPIAKLPKAAKYESETLRLPCNPELTDKEIQYVIKQIKEFCA